jgi:tetratricopeptide (TPR) repeat protein
METGRTPRSIRRFATYAATLGADPATVFELLTIESRLERVEPRSWLEVRTEVIELTEAGNFLRALSVALGAVRHARDSGDEESEAKALFAMATVSKNQHLLAAGRHFCESAIATQALREEVLARALLNLAGFYAATGLNVLVPGILSTIPSQGDRTVEAHRANMMGFHYWNNGDYSTAATWFLKASEFPDADEGNTLRAWAAASAATCLARSGEMQKAIEVMSIAEERAELLGAPGRCFVKLRSGIVESLANDLDRAEEQLRAALRLASDIGHDQWVFESQLHLARVAIRRGQIRTARAQFGIVRSLYRRVHPDREDRVYYSQVAAALREES